MNYYEKYGINPKDDIEAINKQLRKIQRKWISRQNSTAPGQEETLQMIEYELSQLDRAMEIFNPQNKNAKAKYDEQLKGQKEESKKQTEVEQQRTSAVGTSMVTPKKAGISIESVSTAIRKRSVSLTKLKEAQQEIGEQVNALTEKSTPIKKEGEHRNELGKKMEER